MDVEIVATHQYTGKQTPTRLACTQRPSHSSYGHKMHEDSNFGGALPLTATQMVLEII